MVHAVTDLPSRAMRPCSAAGAIADRLPAPPLRKPLTDNLSPYPKFEIVWKIAVIIR